MRNARRLLAALLAVVMLIPSILVPGYAAETTSFKDVREDSWYADAVDYVSAAGYMKGTSKDAFSPGEDVTRAMFVTILSRVARAQTDNTASAFGDVAANQYYSGAIEWAAEKEIVNGVGGGLFAPYRSITRQDLAVMLYRFVNAMGYELSAGESRTYTDEAAISAYAADAVRFVTSTGLFAGYQDGSFRPKATATRAQTAVIVMRLAQLLDGQIVDPEPMPAQSFDQTSEQMQVSVNAPEGALPENTRMAVSRVTDEAALAELASKVDAKVLGAADISFAKDGAELEPARKVSVRISLDALQNAKNPAVVHVKDDGSFEYVSSSVVTTRGKADAIEFEADSFSVYAVIDILGGYTLTVTFYARVEGSTGAWNVVNKQIIRADQLGKGLNPIKDPGVPGITASQAFEGWIESSAAFNPDFAYGVDATTKTIKQINDDYDVTLSTNKEIVYYAAVYEVVYVTYHDQAGAVTSTEYKKIPADQTTVAVTITEDYPPMKSNQNFSGWVKEEDVARPGGVDGTLPTYKEGAASRKWAVGSTQNLSENVDLYPYVEEGYWLSFNNNIAKNSEKLGFEDNTSAEYISPKFVPNGTTPTQPSFPSNDPRHGYTFVRWYKDADMTTEFDFNQQLTEDTTVYAKWAFATTSYRIIYWKQRSTDKYTYTDSQKNYDYFGSRTVTGATTGSVVGISNSGTNNDTTVNVAQNNENNFYFQFNSSKSDKVKANSTVKVKGDGTTVLNVYYDRKTITYNFGPSEPTPTYSQTTATWNYNTILYYKYGSKYYQCFGYSSGGTQYYLLEVTGSLSTSDTYYIRNNNDIVEYKYDSYYGKYVWYDSESDSYYTWSGTVFYATTTAPSPVYRITNMTLPSVSYSYQGLYGDKYPASNWPTAGSGNTWSCYDYSDGIVYQYPLALTQYVPTWQNQSNPTNSYLTMNFYVSEYSTSTIPVKYVGASLTNSSLYNVALANGTARTGGNWYPTETIEGFTIKGYAFLSSAPTASTTWTNCASNSEIPVGASETKTLYVAFTRNNYTLTYSSTTNAGTKTENETIPYEKSLTSYKSHTPANSYPGYYFAGWYLDEEGTQPFDAEKMPARNLIVYAKWNPKWYRIVVDYKRGNSSSVITVPGSTQKASFTMQYGSTIQASSLMQARRVDADGNDNWMLVGLYLDEACTQPFNQNMQVPFGLTEDQEVYPAGSRTGIDDITGETWSDEAYPDVRAKITLYAKWRVNPEGVVGIKVRYLGDHAENDKGYFDSNGKPHSLTLQNPVYTDGAKASAHSATVPSLPDEDEPDTGRRFLYWEILDENGKPTGKIVYPGAPFTIDINDAVEIKTPLPDPNCKHKDENNASTIEAVAAVAPTCTGTGVAAHYKCTKCGRLFTDAAATNETTLDALTLSATGHDWTTNAPTYTWSVTSFDEHTLPTCTATVVCHNDANHVQTETASGTSVSLIVEDGGTTGHYVAHFENELFEDRTSSSFPISRLIVTYQANGKILTGLTETVNPNGTVTLPTAENVPALTGYKFVGWVKDEVTDTTAAPAYKGPGATSDPITAATTFIALYSNEQPTGASVTVYQLVTETPSDWAGSYVVTYGNTTDLYALTPRTAGSSYEVSNTAAAYADTGMQLVNGKLYNVPNTYVFNFASRTGGYTMQSASNSTYVGRYVTTTTKSAYLRSYASNSSTAITTYCRWNFALQSAGNVRIQNVYSDSYDTYYTYMGFSSSYEASLYHCFWVDGLDENEDSEAATSMYLWKQTTESGLETHYTTSVSTYTVTYSVPAGVTAPEADTVVAGQPVTLPTVGAPNSTYTFLGWTAAQTDNATAQPTTLTGKYTPVGTVTLYALYSFVDGSGSGVEYNLVTEAPADWSGSYVITYGTDSSLYAMTGVSGSATGTSIESASNATALASTGMTLSGTKLMNVSDLYKFNVAVSGNYYTIRNASTNTYLGEVGSSYLLGGYSTYVSSYCDWTPGTGANASSATIAVTATGYPYLSFSSDSHYFWSGSTSNTNYTSVRWWKETPVGTTYYTTQIGSSGGETHEHTYGAWSSNSNGTHSRTCSGCGNVETVNCTFTDAITQPTATDPGYTTHTCSVCGYSYNDQTTYRVTFSMPSGMSISGQTTNYRTSNKNTGLVTLPSSSELTNIPSGYTFCGWIEVSSYEGNSEPENLYTSTYEPSACCTLYAVFSKSSGSGTTWAKATSLAAGDKVVLVCEDAGMELTSISSTSTKYGVGSSFSGTPAGTHAYTVSQDSDGYALKNGDYYLYWSYGNSLTESTSNNTNGRWNISFDTSGNATITNVNTSARQIWWNVSSPRFACYTDKSAGSSYYNVQLYKQTSGTTTWTTNPGNRGNAVTQPNLSSGKADSSANLINLSANANPNPLGASDVWVPTTTIDTSKEYLIGISDGSNVYLLANHNGSYYNYSYTGSTTTYTYLYTGTATLDGNNVIGVTGAQTSLDNCKWKFGSSTGGVITNQYDTTKKLAYATSGASSSTTTFYQLYNASSGASSTYSANANTLKFGNYYLGCVLIDSVAYGCVLSSAPSTSVILYTKATTYNVTVASGITNGTVSADKATAAEHDTVKLTVTPANGYEIGTVTYTPDGGSPVTITPVNGVYSFEMPAANVTVNATFTASATPEPGITTIERWIPVDTIAVGEDYLIGFVYDGNTYLGLNTTDYYSYRMPYTTTSGSTATSSTYSFMGYTGTPVFDGENIVGITGNATDLAKATWKFTSVTGGYNIVSGANTSNYLHANARTSSSPYWDQYVSTDVEVWTWDGTHLYNSTNSVYAGMYTSSDLSDVYMCCDTDETSTAISVQLYKKEIVNVYNVTVNAAENGTVRANKSTATAGETVALILTPSDGYEIDTVTVTASNGTQIEVPGANGRYHFTMPAANVTVTATFKKVVADNVWVVSFVDEDGKAIPGMNDVYVQKNTADNLPESALPDPAKEDYYFLGWYQGDDKCTFPMTVNSDIVLTPKYSPMFSYDYTITLRAVYGVPNVTGRTFIYWYANDGTDYGHGVGAGDRFEMMEMDQNVAYDIPIPSGSEGIATAENPTRMGWTGGTQTYHDVDGNATVSFKSNDANRLNTLHEVPDRVFLGWARVPVPTGESGTMGTYHPELTEEDLYLKWTGSKYQVKKLVNGVEQWADLTTGDYGQVYATDDNSYHDMYAVWASFYYVYHSSDGTLEAIQVPFDARETKDLVAEVKTNYLYGGYYRDSGAVVAVTNNEMRAAKDSILNAPNFWNYTTGVSLADASTSLTDEGAVVYNGTSVKHTVEGTTVMFWEKAQAYTELGTELVPTAGTVYYLKEVPKTFLPNRLVYVKADKDTQLYDGTPIEAGKLTSLYLLTAVDDLNYAENGFMVGTANSGQDVTSPDGKSGSADSVSRVFSIILKNKPALHYNANALNDSIVVPEGMNPNLVGFVAAKHLDYNWIQAHKGQTADTATFYLKPYWTTLDGVTVTQDNIKGVNITADGKGISFVNVQ